MAGSKKSSKKESSSEKRLQSSLYFLQWTKSSLQAYTRTLNELYLKKLVEHCTRSKVDEDSSRDEVEQLAAGPRVKDKTEHYSISERLKEAAVRMTQWEGDIIVQHNKVCVAELAAMHRLTQLVKVSGSLLDIMDRTHQWTDKNFSLVRKHSVSLDLIDHVVGMFEATRCIGEVFELSSMELGQCKEQHKKYLGEKAEYVSKDNKKLSISEPKKYIPLLETRINHYRTIVHQLCTAMISILQTLLRYVPQERIDIRVRELKDALDLIPPMYLKVKDMKLTKLADRVLKDPPPNKRSYPLCPKDDKSMKTRSGKSAARSRQRTRSSCRGSQKTQKSNVTRSKYKNPLSQKSREKSQKTLRSDRESVKSQRSVSKGD